MSWKDDFKNGFDLTYERVRRKYPDITSPCYGMRFYYTSFNVKQHCDYLYFYLTPKSILYTASGVHITEIPLNMISHLSVKQGWLFRSSFDIRFRAGESYHFSISAIKDFSTERTGKSSDNVKNFIDTLRASAI